MAGLLLDKRHITKINRAIKWVEQQMKAGRPNLRKPDQLVPYLFRRFELKDDLAVGEGETAEAYLLKSNSDGELAIDENVVFTVTDMQGRRSGTGRTDDEQGTRGRCIKPHDRTEWEIGDLENDGALKWALVESGFSNTTDGATATKDVPVKSCDIDGNNETGSQFNVKTPIRANEDTSLFTDYIVGYMQDNDGNLVITTPNPFDDRMDTVKQWKGDQGDIPDGWSEDTSIAGRMIIGIAPASDWEAVGETGGVDTHTHAAHGTAEVEGCEGGGVVALINTNNHTTVDSISPFYAAYNIIRDS